MRAPGRRVGLCRRSTRLGAPGAAPSHPVLAVRPSCGLLQCKTVLSVNHRHTDITASRYQLTVTMAVAPLPYRGHIWQFHSRSQWEGTPLTPLLKYIPPLVSNLQDKVTTQKVCFSVCYKLSAGPVERWEFREVQAFKKWVVAYRLCRPSKAQVASRWPIPGQLTF